MPKQTGVLGLLRPSRQAQRCGTVIFHEGGEPGQDGRLLSQSSRMEAGGPRMWLVPSSVQVLHVHARRCPPIHLRCVCMLRSARHCPVCQEPWNELGTHSPKASGLGRTPVGFPACHPFPLLALSPPVSLGGPLLQTRLSGKGE